MNRTVVVGSSIAGIRTAQALRSAGDTDEIVVVGEESVAPYDKPPLSKAVLAGTAEVADGALLPGDADVTVLLGTPATGLDLGSREVELGDGRRLGYRDVVIATGAHARPSPWRPRSGVHVLRTAADALALRSDLDRGGPLVVVGAGVVGSEVAATARGRGLEVALVDPLPVPAARVLGDPAGIFLAELHRARGTRLHLGVGVTDVTGEAGDLRVTLTDGRVLPAATVVVGIGAAPNVGWLRGSGLRLHDGVVCDEFGRCAPGVWAVGDVARWTRPGVGATRYEHWTSAVEQAALVARNIAGERLVGYAPVDYVWSDQFDWRLQVAGRPADAVTHRVVVTPDDERFAVVGFDAARVPVGVVTMNWPRAMLTARRSMDDPALATRLTALAGSRRAS
ncbi:NAD(P)/FAD-dependent oxidoreductase [Actinophytocola oryzae]|uniref:Phthalate 3,4-dioxygenase ferredoxin reductase subunit n=1 Tax=Actinophytocola oryzae TaxID=502181 RepID=A0A4R7W3E7_9PSEU|nr:FAD-dependent oxidoreductase [Actinophytocola oryzae]TDV56449.1 phthalate 3,4-dioxygenase ferredoxin reductase subunit [Actinophytocola oryzae]